MEMQIGRTFYGETCSDRWRWRGFVVYHCRNAGRAWIFGHFRTNQNNLPHDGENSHCAAVPSKTAHLPPWAAGNGDNRSLFILTHIKLNTVLYDAYYIIYPFLPTIISSRLSMRISCRRYPEIFSAMLCGHCPITCYAPMCMMSWLSSAGRMFRLRRYVSRWDGCRSGR